MKSHISLGIMLLLISGVFLTGSPVSRGAAYSGALSGAAVPGPVPARLSHANFNLVGLALHQETGRDIYLGAIYFDQQIPRPDDLVGATGPKLMEYKVVARRTSMRSLLGGILLQSEVATGKAPDSKTTEFSKAILAAIKGSLYAGDSFAIMLSEDDVTIAYLNGHELTRVNEGKVSDYLLMGWIGERGAATAFRNDIGSPRLNPDLLAKLQTTTYTRERDEQVASWISSPDNEPDMAANTIAQANITIPTAASAQNTATAAAPVHNPSALPDIPGQALEEALQLPDPEAIIGIATSVDPGITTSNQDPIQVASLTPTAELLQTRDGDDAQSLNVQEYSLRLSEFHSQLITMVYHQIRYPARAIRRGLQGRLELDITVLPDGQLVAVDIVQPSGHSVLDKAAVTAAQNALGAGELQTIDVVAAAEFGNTEDGKLVIPVPVNFILTE
ncbi:MAG: energy transducer TonB [Halioglobus sp.]